MVVKDVCQQDAEQLGDTGEKEIRFRCHRVKGLSVLQAKDSFERTNGALNGNPLVIQPVPLVGVAHDTGIQAFIGVGVDINAASVIRVGTGCIAEASSGFAVI